MNNWRSKNAKGSDFVRIAVADDQPEDRREAEEKIRDYLSENHPQAADGLTIDIFKSAEELLTAFTRGKYDLMVLDIYMEDMTGMEAAEKVRLSDENVPIVFLTTSREHLLDGYRVFAAGYLLKPLAEHMEEFSRTMAHIFPELLGRQKHITVEINGSELDIPIGKITCVDINYQHNVSIHLTDAVMDTHTPYVECQTALLQEKNFIECHHRIIINMDYVRRMEDDMFVLVDGTKVPISQRRKKEAKAEYMRYLVQR